MNDLALTLTIAARRVFSGQRSSARVELTNTSSRVLAVQEPYGVVAPPLVFTFRTSPGSEPAYELSRGQLDNALLGDDTPLMVEPDLVDLQPGASLSTEDDLGELTLGPISVGHYFVRAEWRQPGLSAVSDFVELWVLAPVLLAYAPLLCEMSHEVVGLLAQRVDGGTLLLERRVSTPAPQAANLTPRHFVPAPSVIRDVAIAAHTSDGVKGRWHSWLRDNELWAAQSWGDALMAKPAPLRLHLENPELARPPFHSTSGRGIVVAWGHTERGPALQRFDLEPKRLRAGQQVNLEGPAPKLMLTRALSERGRLAVFWSEATTESTCIRGCILDEKGRLTDGPRVHFTSPLPTLAWNVAPLGSWAETLLHVALGPDEHGVVHYVITPPNEVVAASIPQGFQRALPRFIPTNSAFIDPELPIEASREASPTVPWLAPEAWALGDERHRDPVLFTRCGSVLLLARRSTSGWAVLHRNPELRAEHLHLMTHGEQRWAGWYEPEAGLSYLSI